MPQYDVYPRGNNTTGLKNDGTQLVTMPAGVLAVDVSQGGNAVITLTGNVSAWSIINAQPGQFISITFIQDATGSRTLASAAATIIFLPTVYLATGTRTAPVLTTTPNKRDSFYFYFDGLNYVEYSRAFNN